MVSILSLCKLPYVNVVIYSFWGFHYFFSLTHFPIHQSAFHSNSVFHNVSNPHRVPINESPLYCLGLTIYLWPTQNHSLKKEIQHFRRQLWSKLWTYLIIYIPHSIFSFFKKGCNYNHQILFNVCKGTIGAVLDLLHSKSQGIWKNKSFPRITRVYSPEKWDLFWSRYLLSKIASNFLWLLKVYVLGKKEHEAIYLYFYKCVSLTSLKYENCLPYHFYLLWLWLNYIYLFTYFWLRWVFVAALRLSLVASSRGYSSLWCMGFSLWCLLFLRSTGSRVQAQ